jgi:cold shock CspA family protein
MVTRKVKFYNSKKGNGFITDDKNNVYENDKNNNRSTTHRFNNEQLFIVCPKAANT